MDNWKIGVKGMLAAFGLAAAFVVGMGVYTYLGAQGVVIAF